MINKNPKIKIKIKIIMLRKSLKYNVDKWIKLQNLRRILIMKINNKYNKLLKKFPAKLKKLTNLNLIQNKIIRKLKRQHRNKEIRNKKMKMMKKKMISIMMKMMKLLKLRLENKLKQMKMKRMKLLIVNYKNYLDQQHSHILKVIIYFSFLFIL